MNNCFNKVCNYSFHFRMLVLFILLSTSFINAQDVSLKFGTAYRDYRNYLFYFEDGVSLQIESQPVFSFTSKGNLLGYVNNANNLIAYYDRVKTDLGDASNTAFYLSNHLLIYKRDGVLGVFDKGNVVRLSYFLRDYQMNDELIVFRDQNIDLLKMYYKGKIQELEYTLIGALGPYKVGRNTVAFVNSSGYFKIFHDGQIYEIDNIAPIKFEAGKNIVGFVNGLQQSLNVFYDTKILTLEQFKPISFQVGDDVMAYVSDEGFFKIFSGGKLVKAESYAPEFYMVRDSSVLFFTENKLQLLQNGIRYELDNFKPLNYKMSENCVAWQDNAKRLHFFSNGQSKTITSELFSSYEINGDILRYQLEDGTSHIYYKGKTY